MGLRVLLVDDHRLFREGLKGLLVRRGVEVIGEAKDGEQAIAKTRELRPDVVQIDLQMPGINGLEATRLLKAELPDLPVVILTASEDEADLFEAVKSGAQGYLLKSFDPDTVVDLVQAAANGEPALTPQLASKILAEFARQGGATRTTSPTPARTVPPAEEDIEPLTAREREVLEALVAGATNKEIAQKLVVS